MCRSELFIAAVSLRDKLKLDTRFCTFTVWLTWILVFSSGQSKRRRTHTQTQSFSQWKMMTVLLGNTGERKYSGLWSPFPQRAFFFFPTYKPLPCPALPRPRQLSAQTCSVSLCLGWSSAFFFLIFAADETLTRKRQMTTSEYCKVSHIWTPATAKHKNFGLGTGTSFMLFPPVGLCVCVCVCVCWHFVVSFQKQEFFRFQRIYGFRCGLQTLCRTFRKIGRIYKLDPFASPSRL